MNNLQSSERQGSACACNRIKANPLRWRSDAKSSRRPRVLLIGPVPPPVFGQAVALQEVLAAEEIQAQYRLMHINTNYVGTSEIRRIFRTIWSLVLSIYELVVYRPQVVYLSITRSKLGCIKDCVIMPLARWCGAGVVVHLHAGDLSVFHRSLRPLARRLVCRAYRCANLGIALGESLRSQFSGLVAPERIRVVKNCWEAGELKHSSCRAQKPSGGPLMLSFVSNVLPSKGLYDALEGVAWAIQNGVSAEFRFAGAFLDHDGALAKLPELAHENLPARALEEKYLEMVRALGIEGQVIRLGVVTGRAKWELLSQTNILLLPIYNVTEGQPRIALEAMRAGCAIISTSCGGLIDIVEDDVTGKIVPPRKPEEIGKTIKWFWDHPDELQRISRANMMRADELYSPQRYMGDILSVFDEACTCAGRRS